MGNVYYNGDITQLKTKYTNDPNVPVFDTSGFYFHDAAVQTNGVDDPVEAARRSADPPGQQRAHDPSRWDGLRGAALHQLGHVVREGVRLGRVRAQFHIELYNAFNDVFYNNPNLDPTDARFGHGHEPEQPAAQHPDRDEDHLLELGLGTGRAKALSYERLSVLRSAGLQTCHRLAICWISVTSRGL